MMKVIETNISYANNIFGDHQSRIIEVDNWNEYISLFTDYDGEALGNYKPIFGNMVGCVIPKMATLLNLKYDDFHLSCDIKKWNNDFGKKLAYLIK